MLRFSFLHYEPRIFDELHTYNPSLPFLSFFLSVVQGIPSLYANDRAHSAPMRDEIEGMDRGG